MLFLYYYGWKAMSWKVCLFAMILWILGLVFICVITVNPNIINEYMLEEGDEPIDPEYFWYVRGFLALIGCLVAWVIYRYY